MSASPAATCWHACCPSTPSAGAFDEKPLMIKALLLIFDIAVRHLMACRDLLVPMLVRMLSVKTKRRCAYNMMAAARALLALHRRTARCTCFASDLFQ